MIRGRWPWIFVMKALEIDTLEQRLGHHFQDPELLRRALTHSSRARELEAAPADLPESRTPPVNPLPDKVRDNEQLEFLGDAVLGFVTSEDLYRRFPEFEEGHLSKLRAHLVSGRHLVRVAEGMELGKYLSLGRGEEKSGGRGKSALLVNALEALLAAMYLDAGYEQAQQFIVQNILVPELGRLQAQGGDEVPITDYKSALQEAVHLSGHAPPAYTLVKEEGPEHRKTFTVETRLNRAGSPGESEFVARAAGPTKKRAEQDAARQALEYLSSLPNGNVSKYKPKHRVG
jgi:ribonuclease-3